MTKNQRSQRPDQPIRPTRRPSKRPNLFGPTIGGQPADAVYDLIERESRIELIEGPMLITVDPDDLCAEHRAMWRAAYEHMERELMAEMEACATRHDHEDLTELQWRSLVTHSVADRARELLGIRDLHPFWC
jgi:hypothetical protein